MSPTLSLLAIGLSANRLLFGGIGLKNTLAMSPFLLTQRVFVCL